jgi:ubiquinone/menaquinone biosynthesis C-methylase UbiE
MTTSTDPYARIAELDDRTAAALADRIDARAADPRQRRLWTDFLTRAGYPGRARVLEVGCGTGVITTMIADLPGVAAAVGVDPSPLLVDRARRRAPALRFEVADGRALPFADGSYDGVVFATTLCHIPEPERALAEAHRVLSPNGSLLVYDGDYATATVASQPHDPLQPCVDAAIGALVHDPWLVRRLIPLVREAGFAPEDLRCHGYVEADAPAYMLGLVTVGADTLAATGVLSPATAKALKAEARHRADASRFFGHIAYASLRADRGDDDPRLHPAPSTRTAG